MKYFHGEKRSGAYFEGWYLKHQSRYGRSLALIPAFHMDRAGRRGASLQVIANSGSWWLEYPEAQFHAASKRFQIQLGQSCFGRQGCVLNIARDGFLLRGTLKYGPFTAIRSDIMGPFSLFAGMQCSHGIISMGHQLEGTLNLNGEILDFSGGTGYIETDRGRSFPSGYLWTQCVWDGPENGSLMLAVASIPLPAVSFTGCICAIVYRGREYRLATYQGAKIIKWSPNSAMLRQGKYRLEVELLEEQGRLLRAPVEGSMKRAVHESLCAVVRYCFWKGNEILFQHIDQRASFEYSHP